MLMKTIRTIICALSVLAMFSCGNSANNNGEGASCANQTECTGAKCGEAACVEGGCTGGTCGSAACDGQSCGGHTCEGAGNNATHCNGGACNNH